MPFKRKTALANIMVYGGSRGWVALLIFNSALVEVSGKYHAPGALLTG